MTVRQRVCDDDLVEGEMRGVDLGDRRVLVARVGGRVHALDDWCNHAGCQLSEGRLEGGRVICPCHGMEFDVRSGAALSEPRLCDDQARYPVAAEGGALYVDVGDDAAEE